MIFCKAENSNGKIYEFRNFFVCFLFIEVNMLTLTFVHGSGSAIMLSPYFVDNCTLWRTVLCEQPYFVDNRIQFFV